ncbi:MAG TPA: DUF4350 domain-containing protein [Vicinamibacteria bacterium]
MTEAPFRRPVLVWLVAVGACSLALGLVLVVVEPEAGQVSSSRADGFSRSALGHRAFLDLLRAQGVPVVVSRHASAEHAGDTALLLVAEPQLGDPGRARRLTEMVESVGTALVVLPKWQGQESAEVRGWISSVRPVPVEAVAPVIQAVQGAAAVVRPGAAGGGSCTGTAVPVSWRHPQLLQPVSSALRPLITCPGGVLLGEIVTDERRLLILSDPDPLSNHGLGQGQNAALALEILAHARRDDQVVVVDETLHGHEHVPSLWRELFSFPLLPALVQGVLAVLALVWSGLGRFGAPLPRAPALASGKGVLIDNTAAVLRAAGHSAYSLDRYLEAITADVARALHAPTFARPAELKGWIEAVARRRGVRTPLAELEAQVTRAQVQARAEPALVAAARRIHRWKEEMLRGAQDRPGRPGAAAR